MNYALFERLCGEKGTNPTALARKLGLSKGNTSNWKNGGNPSVAILCKLADELNCTTDSLLGRENEHVSVVSRDCSIQQIDGRECELLKHFRCLPTDEKDKLIGRAQLLAEQALIEENAG